MQLSVHVHNLELPCLIGIDPHEQGAPQRVRFNVTVTLNRAQVPVGLEQTVPYDAIVRYIETLSRAHIDLAETYAAKIASYCLTFPAAAEVVVQLDKRETFPHAEGVGVRVVMQREAAEA